MLESISLISDIDNYDEAQDTVTLMTLHSAKVLSSRTYFWSVWKRASFRGCARSAAKTKSKRNAAFGGCRHNKAKERLEPPLKKPNPLGYQTALAIGFLAEIPDELADSTSEKKDSGFGFGGGDYSEICRAKARHAAPFSKRCKV